MKFILTSVLLLLPVCLQALENKPLKGTFVVTSAQRGDEKETDPKKHGMEQLKFEGDKFVITVRGKEQPCTLKYDLKANPPALDITTKNGELLGIYKVDNDKVTLALSRGDKRPTEFKASSSVMLLELKTKKD